LITKQVLLNFPLTYAFITPSLFSPGRAFFPPGLGLRMSASHALVLDRLLAGRDLPEKSRALLTGLGTRLQRACDLDPAAAQGTARPTGFSQLDRLLAGGLPRGAVLELTGRRTSGRFSVAFAALAATTSSGEPAAFVDLGDHFDVEAAAEAGADLE